jgi:toxin ParE1/3/4
MMTPRLSPAALIRLEEIYHYTVERWDEEQADYYVRELHQVMATLGERKESWRKLADRRLPGVYFVRAAHHFIFSANWKGTGWC